MASRFHFEQWVPFPLDQVFLFFAQPVNLPRLMPPKLDTRIEALKLINPVIPTEAGPGEGPGLRVEGSCVSLAGAGSQITTSFRVLPYLPLRATWVALITEFEWNHHFADNQKLGPFHSFHHRHGLTAQTRDGVAGTVVKDEIELEVGFGWLGKMIEKVFISRQMQQTFHYRQEVLPKLLERD